MNDLIVRPAVESEQGLLVELQRRAALNNPGDRQALLANPDAIELPLEQIIAGQVVVAQRGGEIVGYAAILPAANGKCELDALFVDPSVWRQGIGRVLVEHCLETAQGMGSAALTVVGNPHAQSFYDACGFHQTGTIQTRFGPGALLRKML